MYNNIRKRISLSVLSSMMFFGTVGFLPTEVEAFPTASTAQQSITAQAGIVMDFETGEILYAKNEKQMLDPASISKIMTNYIVFEEIEAGNLSYDTVITIGSYAASIYASVPIKAGDKVTLRNLIELMLVPSSSGSCIAIAEHISGSEAAFVQRMNETAKRLGIDAVYQQSHGSPNFPVNSVSVESQALLIREFITRFPEVLNFTSLRSTTYKGTKYNSTNKFYSSIPYSGIDGFKTGTTTNAGYCFSGTINKDGRRLISVVLKASSTDNRYYDTKKMIDYSYTALQTNSPVYNDIGTHALRSNMEDLYMTGLSPYPLGANVEPNAVITADEFKTMLINLMNNYNIDTKKSESSVSGNLTKETAMSMINDLIDIRKGEVVNFADKESINDLYKQAVYNTAQANILLGGATGGNFSPQESFTKAMALSTLLNMINYIENNLSWLPKNNAYTATDIITLETPITINVPFDFTTYTKSNTLSQVVGNHTGGGVVELLAVKGGNWWQVNINGVSQWLYTDNKLVYTARTTPLYDNLEEKSVVSVISPQVLNVVNEENGHIQISSYLGNVWIDGSEMSKTVKEEVLFAPAENFMLYNDTTLVNGVEYINQYIELLEVTSKNIWKVKVSNVEETSETGEITTTDKIGYINVQDKLAYITEKSNLYDAPDDTLVSLGSISNQVVQVEETSGVFAKIKTWLGSKWVKV